MSSSVVESENRHSYRKFAKVFISNRISSKKRPFFGSIEATRNCNSRCMFCPVGNEKKSLKGGEMNTEQFRRVIDQFAEFDLLVLSFLGGEPTLRKDFAELGMYAKEKGLITQVSTNGLTLADNVDAYTRASDALVVSLDTLDPERYREIRGVDKFDTVLEGIKESVKLSRQNKSAIIINTVICTANMEEIPALVKYSKELGVNGIMIDFATFHDDWVDLVEEGSRYSPAQMDWRNKPVEVRKLVTSLLNMKSEYPILTSRSYLETFLTGDFAYRCHPYVFCCVSRRGDLALPCWDSPYTKFYSLVNGYRLKDIWFSKEVVASRKKLKNCSTCYMHCIVEPSKLLGEPFRNIDSLIEWIGAFRKHGSFVAPA